MSNCFLMKAEPDVRIERGQDVSFSVDKFESVKTTSWEGVRSHQAKSIMGQMRLGDRVLFYASNCKIPGITAIAECVKEAYPDHNAWDSSHPYFDPKSDASKPTWMMVDVEFKSRLNFLVGLKLLQVLSQLNDVPACISTYLTQEHLKAIKTMPLLSRARLSVQTTSTVAYDAVILLGTHGGWEELLAKKIEEKKVAVKAEKKEKRSTPLKKKSKKGKQVVKEEEIDAEEEEEESVQDDEEEVEEKKSVAKKVVKVKQEIKDEIETPDNRRSKRLKKV